MPLRRIGGDSDVSRGETNWSGGQVYTRRRRKVPIFSRSGGSESRNHMVSSISSARLMYGTEHSLPTLTRRLSNRTPTSIGIVQVPRTPIRMHFADGSLDSALRREVGCKSGHAYPERKRRQAGTVDC